MSGSSRLEACRQIADGTNEERIVLFHTRRVDCDCDQRWREKLVLVCNDCHSAFIPKKPQLCRFALANQLWLGRWDPLFRGANLSHQVLLVLAHRHDERRAASRGELYE